LCLLPLFGLAVAGPAPAIAQSNVPGFAVGLASGIGIIAIGAFDIATAPSAARRYNTRVAITPWIDSRASRYGLSLRLRLGTPRHVVPERHGLNALPPATQRPPPKTPSMALLWSLGATLVPTTAGLAAATLGGWNDNHGTLAVGVAGMSLGWLVGPSAGHWYAEQHTRAWLTTGARVALYGIGLWALSTVSFD
jgi:hypothetical protein